jgi:replicative DNA helicase
MAMDSTGHGAVILSGILSGQGSLKALDYALTRVSVDWFDDPVHRGLFTLLHRYADQTHGLLSRAALEDLLRDRKPGVAAQYGETYAALASRMPKQDEFLHSVNMMRVLAAERLTIEALAQGMEILRNGARDEKSGRELRGHEEARAYVVASLAEVERDCGLSATPEGNVLVESREIMAAYTRARELQLKGDAPGVLFGLDALDNVLGGGLLPGELAEVLAWTTAGKSSLCVQTAWHASVVQGKNVVIYTTETLRPQIRVKLVSRHSRHPKFGLERGLNSRDIREGKLTPPEERAFAAVLKDWDDNPEYGVCYVVQAPENPTVSGMGSRMAAIERRFHIELMIADYLQLFFPERSSRDARGFETQASIIQDAKRLCSTFNRGQGVPLITPWQVNGEGRRQLAANNGNYGLEDASGTKEAARTPDLVLSLADQEEDTSMGRHAPLNLKVLKNRDGPKGQRLQLWADFATCLFEGRDETIDESLLDMS